MSELEFVALVIAAIGPLLALAKLTGLPQIFLLAGAGLGSAFLPGLPPVRMDPQFLLSLFLPPLLYAGTVQVSVHLLRFALVSGVVVGALMSVCTILAVAAAARWLLLPGLGWAPALLLGVVAAVFDTRLFQEAKGQPHVPRVVADALKAREMVARVVALSALSLVVGSLETGAPHPLLAAGRLALGHRGRRGAREPRSAGPWCGCASASSRRRWRSRSPSPPPTSARWARFGSGCPSWWSSWRRR